MNRTLLEKEWPAVPVFPPAGEASSGLKAIAEHIASLCETCDACGGLVVDEPRGGLRLVDLWICPRQLPAVRMALQALTRAAVGPDRTPGSVFTSDASAIEAYSWARNQDIFTLRAGASRIDGEWIGNFQLGRCDVEDVVDEWQAAGQRSVYVTRNEMESDTNTVLRFGYVTMCLAEDRACQSAELDGMWSILRSRAEREMATEVYISPEDCVGRSVTFQIERLRDGLWSGGYWNPGRQQ